MTSFASAVCLPCLDMRTKCHASSGMHNGMMHDALLQETDEHGMVCGPTGIYATYCRLKLFMLTFYCRLKLPMLFMLYGRLILYIHGETAKKRYCL